MFSIVSFLCFLIIVVPVSMLVHELGHAFGAILIGAASVSIQLGIGRKVLSLKFGKVRLTIRLIPWFGAYTKSMLRAETSNLKGALIPAGGPIISMAVFAILLLSYIEWTTEWLSFALLFNGWLAIVNTIPFRLGKKQSDGYTVLYMLLHRKHRV